ncbi:MAG: hypothetical protein HFJ53_02080 [Clostridia bacterium]|jgi:hypothetical protein|nr:hypothetical protein [Clostridia bacterium]
MQKIIYIYDSQKLEGYFIGWDYAHCYDYAGYEERLPITIRTKGKNGQHKKYIRK